MLAGPQRACCGRSSLGWSGRVALATAGSEHSDPPPSTGNVSSYWCPRCAEVVASAGSGWDPQQLPARESPQVPSWPPCRGSPEPGCSGERAFIELDIGSNRTRTPPTPGHRPVGTLGGSRNIGGCRGRSRETTHTYARVAVLLSTATAAFLAVTDVQLHECCVPASAPLLSGHKRYLPV